MTVVRAQLWWGAWLVLGLACDDGEPAGTSGTTSSGSTEAGATSGGTDGADSSSTTLPPWPMTGDGPPPPPSQTQRCAAYVACAEALALAEAESIEQTYGPDAMCWQQTAVEASACDDACEEELAALVVQLETDGQEVPDACDPPQMISLSRVEEIFDAGCVEGCHEPGGQDSSLDLANEPYFGIYQVASDQSDLYLVEPGDHQQSYLWHKVNGSHGSVGGTGGRMPKGSEPLLPSELEDITDWIDQGANNF